MENRERKLIDDSTFVIPIIGIPDELKIKLIRTFTKTRSLTDSDRLRSGVESIKSQIVIDNTRYNYFDLYILDIVEHYARLQPGYFREASAVIATFDKGDRNSVKTVMSWCRRLKRFIPQAPIALVGFITKSDKITTDECQTLAKKLGACYYETKPTDKEIIKGIFQELTSKVLRKKS